MPEPAESAVELSFFDMRTRVLLWQQDLELLNQEEQVRAARFHFERDRSMFVCCRAQLRRILAEHTGCAPAAIQLQAGPRGKPALVGGKIEFNVSHAGHWFACAVSEQTPLGVDIEEEHPLRDMVAVAEHFFAPAEVMQLFATDEKDRTRSFFECWTRKEAVIKATGEGISRPLDSFEVAFGPGVLPALLRLDSQKTPGWQMLSFEPAPGYIAALTATGRLGPVRTLIYSR